MSKYLLVIMFRDWRDPFLNPDAFEMVRYARWDAESPTWGEERITTELKLKLGTRFSPGMVHKYLTAGGHT